MTPTNQIREMTEHQMIEYATRMRLRAEAAEETLSLIREAMQEYTHDLEWLNSDDDRGRAAVAKNVLEILDEGQ